MLPYVPKKDDSSCTNLWRGAIQALPARDERQDRDTEVIDLQICGR